MSYEQRNLTPIPLKEVAFGSIGAGYGNLGSAIPGPVVILTVKNNTDQSVYISFNGTDNHMKLPAGNFDTFDIQANGLEKKAIKKNIQVQIKHAGASPASGEVILQGWLI